MIDPDICKGGAHSICVHCAGSNERPSFVFLHGWPQSSRAFLPVMRALADDYFAVAIDLPGIGGSKDAQTLGDTRRHQRVCSRFAIGGAGERDRASTEGMRAFLVRRSARATRESIAIVSRQHQKQP